MQKKRNNKAQAAMEFLMTYGWAILIVLIVLAILFALDVFSPEVKNTCDVDLPFTCKDLVFREEGFEILLSITDINSGSISNVKVNNQVCSKVSVNNIQNGQAGSEIKSGENKIRCYGVNIKKNDKVNTEISIDYSAKSGLQHNIKAKSQGKTDKSNYIINFDDNAFFSFDFNNDNNINAIDNSYYNNNGVLNGVTLETTDCITGKCYNFDGTNDYIEITNSATLENIQESSYTMVAWFKPTNTPPGTGSANNAHYGIVIKTGLHEGIFYTNGNKFTFDHWLSSGGGAGVTTTNTFTPGNYYHVVGVMDKTNGKTKIYVDGNLEGTSTWTPNAASIEYGTITWKIGIANPGASSWGWPANGKIDDVRIYDKALTDSEVEEIYKNSKK